MEADGGAASATVSAAVNCSELGWITLPHTF